MKKLVMIGNGMAGIRTIEEILKLAPEQFSITIFGQEPYPNYNRIKLSNILQGDTSFEEIIMKPLEWYQENQLQLFTGEAVAVDPYKGSVTGTQLKVAGVDLYSAGEILEDPSTKAIKVYNEFDGVYKKILIRNQTIVGVVLYGDTKDSTKLFRMLTKKEDISGKTSVSLLQSETGD